MNDNERVACHYQHTIPARSIETDENNVYIEMETRH